MDSHTLYAAPMTCSLAVRIALAQHALPFTVEMLERGPDRRIADAGYRAVHAFGKVPALRTPGGEVMTEIIAILDHLESTHGIAREGSARRRHLSWLSFIATELHQPFLAPAFALGVEEGARMYAPLTLLERTLTHLERALQGQETLLGLGAPTGADAYLYWALLLARHRWPERVRGDATRAFLRAMGARPFVASELAVDRAAFAA